MGHQLVIMLQRLAKAEARVEHDILHTQVAQLLYLAGKVQEDLTQQVVVVRMLLHVLGCSLHMHHDVGDIQFGYRTEHVGIHLTRRDVVDDSHAILFDTHPRHICPKGIDRHDGIGSRAAQHFQPKAQTIHLLLGRHMIGIGTRRIGTHIDDGRAFLQNLSYASFYLLLRLHAAPAIERVGRHVQNTHHTRRREIEQPAVDIQVFRLFLIHGNRLSTINPCKCKQKERHDRKIVPLFSVTHFLFH